MIVHRRFALIVLAWALHGVVAVATHSTAEAQEWSVPVAGNAYRSQPNPQGRSVDRTGGLAWSDPDEVYSIYFHVDRAAQLELALDAKAPDGASKLRLSLGEVEFTADIEGPEFKRHPIGTIKTDHSGYVRIDLKGIERTGPTFALVRGLSIHSQTEGLKLTCVATNEGNMFYWGRRGPSVHLRYGVPRDVDLEYAYSEITVAKGDDPIGSYFMANGFGEGYFGIQVNSATERRVLFSVWSPFQTDDPKSIPDDQRIALLARGTDVKAGEFGNEGSGGQSFLVYPWVADRTYRFLTRVQPSGDGSTVYTSWFGDKQANEWRLIASFRRPKTNTYLRGFHSFLENFDPRTGHLSRRVRYSNIWVCDREGAWHECTTARFSVDATGGGGHRLDFDGGAQGETFYLRNCGFFHGDVPPGTEFTRDAHSNESPQIDFERLPVSDP